MRKNYQIDPQPKVTGWYNFRQLEKLALLKEIGEKSDKEQSFCYND
ncbi:hypothetical protein J5566_02420 [Streptococcus suis]|nr:hypothetical protein [Streptococcus suis]